MDLGHAGDSNLGGVGEAVRKLVRREQQLAECVVDTALKTWGRAGHARVGGAVLPHGRDDESMPRRQQLAEAQVARPQIELLTEELGHPLHDAGVGDRGTRHGNSQTIDGADRLQSERLGEPTAALLYTATEARVRSLDAFGRARSGRGHSRPRDALLAAGAQAITVVLATSVGDVIVVGIFIQ